VQFKIRTNKKDCRIGLVETIAKFRKKFSEHYCICKSSLINYLSQPKKNRKNENISLSYDVNDHVYSNSKFVQLFPIKQITKLDGCDMELDRY